MHRRSGERRQEDDASVNVRVELERTGGIAGRTLRRLLDTADLPGSTSEELRRRVDAVRAIGSPAPAPAIGADRFTYRVTIREDAVERTLTAVDPLPEQLGRLVGLVLEEGRPSGPV